MGTFLRVFVFALATVMFAVTGGVSAADVPDDTTVANLPPGEAAAAQGDYETAFKEWSALAADGDAKAQYNLASLYYNGWGVEQDFQKAFELYNKSAEQGLAEAQNMVGSMHQNGQATLQHYRRAVEWFRLAAEQGNAVAQHNLSVLLFRKFGIVQVSGKTSEEDINAEARKWQKLAVEAKVPEALFIYGNFLRDGQFYGEDYEKAYNAFLKAAEVGHPGAQYNVGDFYYRGLFVERDKNKAREWFFKAALQGVAQAHFNLGMMFFADGEKGSKEHVISLFWTDLVIEGNNEKLLASAKRLREEIVKALNEEQIAAAAALVVEFQAKLPSDVAPLYRHN